MANNNVKFFKVNLLNTYLNLAVKDENALYWVAENQTLYLGSKVYGTGQLASETAKGLLSAEDYVALKSLITSSSLTAIDGTISITNTDDGKAIGVAIAPVDGNALVTVEGGLFVPETSVKLADNAHGLVAVDGVLTLNLATHDSDGAMSKEDKQTLDELKDSVSLLNEACTWGEM